jgi:uncharacterized protein (DUF58 family)
MGYGEGLSRKLRYSESLAATLAYLLLRQGDSVGAGAFSGNGLSLIPPKAGNSYITPVLQKLESLTPSGDTALAEPLLKALETFRQDSSFVIISDLLTDEGEIERSLQLLRAAKKETVIFHVLHEDETELPFRGPLEFLDMESEERVIVDTDAVRDGYRKRIKEFTERLKLLCHEYESRYVLSPTSRPVEEALLEIADK